MYVIIEITSNHEEISLAFGDEEWYGYRLVTEDGNVLRETIMKYKDEMAAQEEAEEFCRMTGYDYTEE